VERRGCSLCDLELRGAWAQSRECSTNRVVGRKGRRLERAELVCRFQLAQGTHRGRRRDERRVRDRLLEQHEMVGAHLGISPGTPSRVATDSPECLS